MMSRTASRVLAAVVLGALAGVAIGGRLDAADEPAKDRRRKRGASGSSRT